MSNTSLRGAELKKLVAVSKKRDLAFAYCPAGTTPDDVFYLDRKKKPDVIGRTARAESEGSKLGFGMAKTKGRVMTLTCDREMAGMAKKLKKYLKQEKCPMNVVVLDKNGNVLEEDIEDLPEDPELDAMDAELDAEDGNDANDGSGSQEDTGNENEDNDADEDRIKALRARAADVQEGIKASPSTVQAPLIKGFKSAVTAIQGGNLDVADATLTKLEAALDKVGGSEGAAPPPPPEADPAKVKLLTVAAQLGNRIAALQDSEGKTKLETVHASLLAQIEAGEYPKAAATAKALGEAITKVSAGQAQAAPTDQPTDSDQQDANENATAEVDPNASEDGKAWNAARATFEPVVLSLLERGMGDVSKMRAAWSFFTEKGLAGAFADGMRVVPGLEKLIAQAEAAEQSDAEKDIPADIVPFVRARISWSKARTKLQSEMMKLENAILAACQGEEFAGMASDTKALFTYLETLDDRLEAALFALEAEPDGARRETLKGDARKVLGEYQTELQTPFFKDVDGNNGFASVSVTGTATTALAAVNDALSKAA
ncbi:MAG: hypothetical protein AAF214_09480 [Pseudomonadota bacterium]